jgi:hypothetical protein
MSGMGGCITMLLMVALRAGVDLFNEVQDTKG